MRYLIIPDPAVFDHLPNHPVSGKPQTLTFHTLVQVTLGNDPKVTADHASIDRYLSLTDELDTLKSGDVWALQDEDHEWLSKLAKDFQYNPDIKRQVLRLVRSITGASKEKPSEKSAEEKLAESKPRAEA